MALVYDVMDTEGKDLPTDVASFFARGSIDEKQIASFLPLVNKKGILWRWMDAGDQRAGWIRVVKRASDESKEKNSKEKEVTQYEMCVNKNHSAAVQFATLTHELGHLFLGHLGADKEP